MENQNIQWANWEEQPQDNNEQPQVNWGEQPQQEQPQQSWGEQQLQHNGNIQQPSPTPTWDWKENELDPLHIETPSDFTDLETNDWESKTSILGLLPKLKVEALLYKFNYNDPKAISQIDLSNLKKLNDDGKYEIPIQENSDELINILTAIKNIGKSRGMKLIHSYLYKNSSNESSINISRGECLYNYVYFLQANHNSGDVILDFSSINGPSEQVMESSTGILLLLPGWVPYRITKNNSNQDMIAIAGRFVAE